MTATHERDRYLLVTSDAHGGAAMADYRPYLDPKWHPEFDEWLAGVVMPWVDVRDTSNWDNDVRLAHMDADGVSAEIVFPNTLPPFFDILAHLSGVPRDRATFERKWAGLQAHNRWLVDFCREAPLRRRGIVQLLPNDIDVAIAELRWAADHRQRGRGDAAGDPRQPRGRPVLRPRATTRSGTRASMPASRCTSTREPDRPTSAATRSPPPSSSPSSSSGRSARCTT